MSKAPPGRQAVRVCNRSFPIGLQRCDILKPPSDQQRRCGVLCLAAKGGENAQMGSTDMPVGPSKRRLCHVGNTCSQHGSVWLPRRSKVRTCCGRGTQEKRNFQLYQCCPLPDKVMSFCQNSDSILEQNLFKMRGLTPFLLTTSLSSLAQAAAPVFTYGPASNYRKAPVGQTVLAELDGR